MGIFYPSGRRMAVFPEKAKRERRMKRTGQQVKAAEDACELKRKTKG